MPDLATVFASVLREYYSSRGGDLDDPATATTIRVNTTLVEGRAKTLLTLLGELLRIESLDRMRVLEAGSGFGALAAYLALAGARRVVGIDTNEAYIEVGRESALRLGVEDRLTFEVVDMRSMEPFADASFDLLIANNSFLYLPTPAGAAAALHEFRRVLVPGGSLLIYQANRWRLREPFTNDPLVHLLTPKLADIVSRATGWRHNHGRIRLRSSGQMRRDLRRAGLEPAGTVAFGPKHRRHRRILMRNLGTWYGQAARRPE